MGQGALVLDDPVGNIGSPFFQLVPEWGRLPVVVLAAAATVIASRAVITGAFSVASQAAQLGYLPRLRIRHTSAETIGQIGAVAFGERGTDSSLWRPGSDRDGEFGEDRLEPAVGLGVVSEFVVSAP
jgi:hypothetical protein